MSYAILRAGLRVFFHTRLNAFEKIGREKVGEGKNRLDEMIPDLVQVGF